MARGSARGGGGMVTGQIDTCIIYCLCCLKNFIFLESIKSYAHLLFFQV